MTCIKKKKVSLRCYLTFAPAPVPAPASPFNTSISPLPPPEPFEFEPNNPLNASTSPPLLEPFVLNKLLSAPAIPALSFPSNSYLN